MPAASEKWDAYRQVLDLSFRRAEEAHLSGRPPSVEPGFQDACEVVFSSKTQAYREVLVGCMLTRIVDPDRDIRLPYVDLGDQAYSGRSLDERVVNPLLQEKNVPCSRGPYLSVFRRQVAFDQATRKRLRDKGGYDALLEAIAAVESCEQEEAVQRLLDHVMYRFAVLRDEASVDLFQLERMSLVQHTKLIEGLLERSSGGVFPCVMVLAMVEVIARRFSLPWTIESQGINVADTASGVGGDITITQGERHLLTIEVTERKVDASRVRATFRAKIAAAGLSDYVFAVHLAHVESEAIQQAEKYFSQGLDVSFVDIRDWLVNSLVTVGSDGRAMYHQAVRQHLASGDAPAALKVAWNEEVEKLTR